MSSARKMKLVMGSVFVIAMLGGCASTNKNVSTSEYKVVEAEITRTHDKAVVANGEGKKHKLICKRERKTGTHVVKRVCRTEAQVAEMRKRSKEDADSWKTKGNVCTNCTGN